MRSNFRGSRLPPQLFSPAEKFFRHRVVPALRERVAPEYPPDRKYQAQKCSVLFNGYHAVLGAGGNVFAAAVANSSREISAVKVYHP